MFPQFVLFCVTELKGPLGAHCTKRFFVNSEIVTGCYRFKRAFISQHAGTSAFRSLIGEMGGALPRTGDGVISEVQVAPQASQNGAVPAAYVLNYHYMRENSDKSSIFHKTTRAILQWGTNSAR